MSSDYILVDQTLNLIISRLQVDHGALTQPRFVAIRRLLECLEDGLRGRLSPGYHLSSLDPGMGKTLSVTSFLKVWREADFKPTGSVLIGVSTKKEIATFMENAGLQRDQVAMFTADDEINALGCPEEDHEQAPVMFTTHAMISSRTRQRAFSEVAEFHYQGAPRSLRVWDESIEPGEW